MAIDGLITNEFVTALEQYGKLTTSEAQQIAKNPWACCLMMVAAREELAKHKTGIDTRAVRP
ncbi:hypothetical protein HY504_02615 [Candidatus Wolfebacteria bacterium]|nr:hypothetical protein [Candidatus Wolfebacteria bacterium]